VSVELDSKSEVVHSEKNDYLATFKEELVGERARVTTDEHTCMFHMWSLERKIELHRQKS